MSDQLCVQSGNKSVCVQADKEASDLFKPNSES